MVFETLPARILTNEAGAFDWTAGAPRRKMKVRLPADLCLPGDRLRRTGPEHAADANNSALIGLRWRPVVSRLSATDTMARGMDIAKVLSLPFCA